MQHVLPITKSSDTGDTTSVLSISLVPLSVPLHRLSLTSDLVNDEVVMGVQTSLPVEGVDAIGNDMAGAKVWINDPPSLELTSRPDCTSTRDECAKQHPYVSVL